MDMKDIESRLTLFSLAIDQLKRNMNTLCELNSAIVSMNKGVSLVVNATMRNKINCHRRSEKTKELEKEKEEEKEAVVRKQTPAPKRRKPKAKRNRIELERIFERLPPRFVNSTNLEHIKEIVLFLAKNQKGCFLKDVSDAISLPRVKTSQLLVALVNSGDVNRENIRGMGLSYKLTRKGYR